MTNLSGKPVNPVAFTSYMRAAAARVGISMSPHKLRPLHASELLSAGVHPKIAQERLGHSDVVTTLNIYSHVMEGRSDHATDVAADVLIRL